MSLKNYRWERNRKIAEGELKTYTTFDEHEYDGELTPGALGAWLMQFDNSWTIDFGSDDAPLLVFKARQVPYTEDQIKAAKAYIDTTPNPDVL